MREAVIPPPMSAYEIHINNDGNGQDNAVTKCGGGDGVVLGLMFQNTAQQQQATPTSSGGSVSDDTSLFGITGCRSSSKNIAILTRHKLYIFTITTTGTGEGGCVGNDNGAVRITGAGGNGYVVQTSWHELAGCLALDGGVAEAYNFTWIGDRILASVDFPSPAVLVFQVRGK